MNGSNINYAERMDLCAQRLARVTLSKIAIHLMDGDSVSTMDLLDGFEDEILESEPTALRLVEMKNALATEYRAEFGTHARLAVLQQIAAIPARFANAQAAAQRRHF